MDDMYREGGMQNSYFILEEDTILESPLHNRVTASTV